MPSARERACPVGRVTERPEAGLALTRSLARWPIPAAGEARRAACRYPPGSRVMRAAGRTGCAV